MYSGRKFAYFDDEKDPDPHQSDKSDLDPLSYVCIKKKKEIRVRNIG